MTSPAAATNHQVRLARRPVGLPVRADWSFTAEPVAPPQPGGVLVKTLLLSLDPAMRGWMNEGKSYIAPVGIDEVMRAGGIGVVAASANPGVRGRRSRERRTRRSGVRRVRRAPARPRRAGQDRPAHRHADAVAERARHAGHDRLLRPARRRPAEGGRDGRRLRRSGCRRPDRRAARQDQGLPRGRDRRRPGEVRLGGATSSASTPASTTRPARSRTA